MNGRLLIFAGLFLGAGAVTAASAGQRCSVRVLQAAKALESPDTILQRGSKDFAYATGMEIDRKTGAAYLCSHGSFCYQIEAFEFTSPCSFGKLPEQGDPDLFIYETK